MWLEHKEFEDYMKQWWNNMHFLGWKGYKFMLKLRSLQEFLKKWNIEVFGDLRLEKRNLMERLEAIDRLESTNNWSSQKKEESFLLKASYKS